MGGEWDNEAGMMAAVSLDPNGTGYGIVVINNYSIGVKVTAGAYCVPSGAVVMASSGREEFRQRLQQKVDRIKAKMAEGGQ